MSNSTGVQDLVNIISASNPQELINLLIISAIIAAVLLIIGLKTKSIMLGIFLGLIFIAYGTSAYVEASSIRDSWEYIFLDQDYRQLVELVLMVGYFSWVLGAIVIISPIIKQFTKPKPSVLHQSEGQRFCANCGAIMNNEAQFCSKCGESVGILK